MALHLQNVRTAFGPKPGEKPIQKGRGCSSYLLEVKKAALVPFRVFSIKSSTAGAFVVPYEGTLSTLSQKKKYDRRY